MPTSYSIFQNGQSVGTAQVSEKGLYYEIQCWCSFAKDGIYKITVKGPAGSINLGTCVRSESKFVINTRVPIKKIGKGNFNFQVLGNQRIFAEIKDGEPFPYMMAVFRSHLSCKDGKIGIWITPE